MAETWKDVAGYEGLYQVSDQGNVRSKRRRGSSGGIMKPKLKNDGYLQVALYRERKQQGLLVHRLVAEAFISNPLNLLQVNHKDEDKTNNAANNLEWCTAKYNSNYGTCQARKAAKCSKAVLQYDKEGNFVREWPSTHEVERQTGFAQSHISKCCRGELKSVYGFIWKYKN